VLDSKEKGHVCTIIKRPIWNFSTITIIISESEERFREIGFKNSPYDPCVANRIANESTHIVK
jgi:hypothetical protein